MKIYIKNANIYQKGKLKKSEILIDRKKIVKKIGRAHV